MQCNWIVVGHVLVFVTLSDQPKGVITVGEVHEVDHSLSYTCTKCVLAI